MTTFRDHRSLIMRSRDSGFALLLVLAGVVLLTIVALAFFQSMATELRSSKVHSHGISVRMVADSAIDLVESQILEATSQTDQSWASQPGRIRTFTLTGAVGADYKLYSAAPLVVAGGFDVGTEATPNDVPTDWETRPDEFVDLNSPILGRYPILDPAALTFGGNPGVAGLSVDPAWLTTGAGGEPEKIPMPVRWLYLLADGQLEAMDAGSKEVPSATDDNPIVARLAFWTDDETSKIDINTAGEGTYWDTPRAWSQEDIRFAKAPPWQHEYQRYPGHPGTVSLSTVFHEFDGATPAKLDQLYQWLPRYHEGGSKAGTVQINKAILKSTVLDRADARLYASLDELTFQPNSTRTPGTDPFTPARIDKLRFVLTAYNRMPELNVFGLPRISMWPQPANLSDRTGSDKLFAFSSTIGGEPFYFTRQNAYSPTDDFTNSPRNQILFKYLQTMTSRQIPGQPAGSDFFTKYGDDRDQILAEMFDYIRVVNLVDPQKDAVPYAAPAGLAGGTRQKGFGQVVPIEITTGGKTVRGLGRIATLSEVAVMFFAQTNDDGTPVRQDPNDANSPRMYRALLLLEPSTMMQGYAQYNGDYSLTVSGLDSFHYTTSTVTDQSLGFPATGKTYVQGRSGSYVVGAGGIEATLTLGTIQASSNSYKILRQTDDPRSYPFYSAPFPIPEGDVQFTFSGGTISVTLDVEEQAKHHTVQEFKDLVFPPATVLTPGDAVDLVNQAPYVSQDGRRDRIQWAERYYLFIQGQDRVISIEPTGPEADYRLLTLQKTVDPNMFQRHTKYDDIPVSKEHSLTANWVRGYRGTDTGNMVQGVGVGDASADINSHINGVKNIDNHPGDWDNGVGQSRDGAYANKPDEGNFNYTSSSTPYAEDHGFAATLGYETYFMPNRQVPSPGMFGSLPSRAQEGSPWETLLFCPNPAAGAAHRGFNSPPDYLWMDLFWMPVVEPYAISEPFSTAGKVNLNYQIAPFTYIHRDTAVRAAMKDEKIMRIPASQRNQYKAQSSSAQSYRYAIDPETTLAQFQDKFDHDKVFRTASEICSIHLSPADSSAPSDERLSGDNTRERPYVNLYQKVTTQSNTYTVHMRAQTIKKTKGADPKKMTDRDSITGEYRGSALIERYLDPNADYASHLGGSNPDNWTSLADAYRFRTIEKKQFLP